MADPITMMAIGAGVGALKGAVTGGNPLKEALIGGVLGGVTGGAGQALGLGGAAAGTAGTAANLAPEAGAAALGSIGSSAGTAASLGAGTAATNALPLAFTPVAETAGGSLLASSSPLLGYTASGISPFLGAAEAAAIPTASSIGAGFGANTIANMATNPSLYDQLSKYATIDNLAGANAIASRFQPTPRSPAPQGRVTEGRAPQGGIGQGGVEGLLAELQKRQQQQYQPISLL